MRAALSAADTVAAPPLGDAQPLVGFMSNDEWDALLGEVNALVQAMESLPAGEIKTSVFRLLDGIDALHREALHRLVRLFKEGVLEKVVSDPAIHTLMELYDLLPAGTEPAPAPKPAFPTIPIRAVRTDPPLRFPHWLPVLAHQDALAPGALRDDIVADDVALILARRGEQLFALDGSCPVDGASLRGATLDGYTLACPAHTGCLYDVRSGARVGGGDALGCHPLKVDEQGRVLVGLDMDFKPALPSF